MTLLITDRQVLSQHKQCNNLAVLGSKCIQLPCRFGRQIGYKNVIFTFSGTLQISRGFFFLASFEKNLLKNHAKILWQGRHLYRAPAVCWSVKLLWLIPPRNYVRLLPAKFYYWSKPAAYTTILVTTQLILAKPFSMLLSAGIKN